MSVSLNDLPNKVYSSGDTVTVTTGSGIEGPQGPTGATGAGGTVAYYGNFFSTETQNNAGATVASTFTLNSTVDANGISIVDSTKITFAAGSDGTYDLQFSVQFDKTDSGTDEVDVWLSKNGNYEAWSNTTLSLVGNNAKVVAAWNFQLNDVVGGDYFELHWWSPDTSMRALAAAAGSSPTRPAVPSIIVTVAQVTYTQAGPQGPTGPQGQTGATGAKGDKGDTGAAGAAATVAVGTTTTGAAGTSASVVNSGTSSAAVLNFTIPRGDTGATGATGPEGGTSTLTTKGDLLTRTTTAVARLPVGATTGHVLTVDPAEATGMKWAASSGGIPQTLIDAKGDLIVGSAADTAARLAVGGTNDHVLTVDSAQTLGVKWAAAKQTLIGVQPRLTDSTYSGVPGVGSDSAALSSVATGVANRAILSPFAVISEPITITSAELRVTTQAASASSARIAIYNVNKDWTPTTLVADLGTVSIASTGRKEISSLSVVLQPGYYASCVMCELAVTIELKGGSTIWWSNFLTATNAPARIIRQAYVLTYGPAPDPHPALNGGTVNEGGGGVLEAVSFKWTV